MKLQNVLPAFGLALSLLASAPAQADKFALPQHYTDLEWFTIETEHFYVHYAASKDQSEANDHVVNPVWSARKIAKVSEEMWAPMCAEFNYYLKEKIHVVLLDQPDFLTGFTIPAWDWIEISANPGPSFYRMRGRMEWFSDVMVHEFAHVISLKANSPFAEGTGGVLLGGLYTDGINNTASGAEVFLGDSPPFWWTEGGAEYWSDNAGYNWWSSSRDMNIRTTVLEDRLLTYDEWVTRIEKRDWGDGERGYQQGYSIALYLRERFGDETFAQFALESQKGFHGDWEVVIEDVLGIPLRQLYDDWVDYLTERYTAVWDRVRAEGEVQGRELSIDGRAEWEYTDADGRDAWLAQEKADREDKKEATSKYAIEARISADGQWWGVNNYPGVIVTEVPDERRYSAFNGGVAFGDPEMLERQSHMTHQFSTNYMSAWDFIPGTTQLVRTGNEFSYAGGYLQKKLGLPADHAGYNWNQLWIVDFTPREETKNGDTYETIKPGKQGDFGKGRWAEEMVQAKAIPNTLRGSQPSVAPNGEELVYFQYGDGTLNLVRINLDGTDKVNLTNWDDGTWLQRAEWSPDGQQILLVIFRNFQQDIYLMNRDGSDLRALTWDSHEEQDAYWHTDGMIYFSADPDGIFNIFKLNPETNQITQLTNVIGGAQTPRITPEGNLIYTNFTAHGWKLFGVDKAEFLDKDASDSFVTDVPTDEVEAVFAFSEDLSMFEELTSPYQTRRAFIPPTTVPILRIDNDSQVDWNIQAGFQTYAMDFAEYHNIFGQILVGQTIDVLAGWTYHRWKPDFFFLVRRLAGKGAFGYLLDEDEDPTTTDDKSIYDYKQNYAYTVAYGSVDYPLGKYLHVYAGIFGMDVGFKGVNDTEFERYLQKGTAELSLTYTKGASYRNRMNPRGARLIDLSYTRGATNVVYEPSYGVVIDDGEKLSRYGYNRFDFRWTEHLKMPDLLNKWRGKPTHQLNTLQVDFQFGFIDRNVMGWDEYNAGGRHPYYWGQGAFQPNTFFAGYPANAMGGETLAIINLAYRFPVVTKMNKKVGPMYFYDVYAQVMGTAGNIWSYRPPDEPGSYYTNRYDDRIAYDPNDIVREVPFKDYSYKNSPQECTTDNLGCNYLLFDVGAEIRVGASLFNRGSWDSFLRVAYGFNDIRGSGGDIDGDGLIDASDSALGDSLSNEVEPGSLRVYVGVGTGW